ncbi:MAG: hypothetical protein ACOYXT_30180 [Bacteroidota bacterium]
MLVFCLFIFEWAEAQRSNNGRSSYTRSRHNYTAPRVRGNKAKIICPIFESSKYPYHGFGVKLGDPFAMTYKFYPNKRFSFAVDFGKAASGLYNRYYREKFDEYVASESDTFSTTEASVDYLTHKVKSDLVGEVKFLYHLDAKKVSPGLQIYVGAGWEWKNTALRYDYLFDNGQNENQFGRFERSRFTMGPQIVVGIEYAYFQIPISAFMELEYFTDIQADPGWQNLEGGVGLRYIF